MEVIDESQTGPSDVDHLISQFTNNKGSPIVVMSHESMDSSSVENSQLEKKKSVTFKRSRDRSPVHQSSSSNSPISIKNVKNEIIEKDKEESSIMMA